MKEKMITVKPIMLETVILKVKGISPYLVEPMDMKMLEDYDGPKKPGKKVKVSEKEKVKNKYYYTEDGKKGIPARAFYKAMIRASSYLIEKKDGGMRNVKEGIKVMGEILPLKFSSEKVLTHWGRASGMTGAPRLIMRNAFYDWECTLEIRYNAKHLTADHIFNILNWAGFHIGVGGFRKECTGNFGEFKVEI